MSHPISLMVTGAGGAGTIEIIRTLKALGRYRIIALDASPYAAGFVKADASYVVPVAVDPSFTEALRSIIATEQPDFLVPLVDEEILIAHALASQMSLTHLRIVAPSLAFCRSTLDKWLTYRVLTHAGVPTPRTWLASEPAAIEFPAVVKPRDGRGSRGLAYLQDADDLSHYLACAAHPADGYVVQRRVDGREYTVSVIVGLGGPLLAVVPKEVLVKQGITQVGITRAVPMIEALCTRIQDQLRADGPFNVQLIIDSEGAPQVIEINPRYSTTVALTIAAGVHEVDIVIRHALGESIESLAFQPDLMMLRYPTQHYASEAAWLPIKQAERIAVVGTPHV